MALSRIFLMAARTIASNPRLRKELGKAAQKSYEKAKPYIKDTSEKVQKAAQDAATESKAKVEKPKEGSGNAKK